MTTLLNCWPKCCLRDWHGVHAEARSLTSKRDALALTADSIGESCLDHRDTECWFCRGRLKYVPVVKGIYENLGLGTLREPASPIGTPNFFSSELKFLSQVLNSANSAEKLATARSGDWLLEEGSYSSCARTKHIYGQTLTRPIVVS